MTVNQCAGCMAGVPRIYHGPNGVILHNMGRGTTYRDYMVCQRERYE